MDKKKDGPKKKGDGEKTGDYEKRKEWKRKRETEKRDGEKRKHNIKEKRKTKEIQKNEIEEEMTQYKCGSVSCACAILSGQMACASWSVAMHTSKHQITLKITHP